MKYAGPCRQCICVVHTPSGDSSEAKALQQMGRSAARTMDADLSDSLAGLPVTRPHHHVVNITVTRRSALLCPRLASNCSLLACQPFPAVCLLSLQGRRPNKLLCRMSQRRGGILTVLNVLAIRALPLVEGHSLRYVFRQRGRNRKTACS